MVSITVSPSSMTGSPLASSFGTVKLVGPPFRATRNFSPNSLMLGIAAYARTATSAASIRMTHDAPAGW